MRKIRKVLQVLLFINFMVGLHDGMKVGNLIAILVNGLIVLEVIVNERRRLYENRNTGKDTRYWTTGNGGSDW